jgi:translation initiation factor IF-3
LNQKKDDKTQLNEQIRFPEVRCMGDDGEQFGIISSKEAYAKAQDLGLDLVLIAPNGKPPVVKIMDYGKFKYQEEKKKKEARKKQTKIEVKEVKLSVKIAQNDVNYKIKHALEFLSQGKHVKFRVFLRGREMGHPEAGVEVLNRVIDMVGDAGVIEKKPHQEGRFINMYCVPPKDPTKKH